MSNVDRRTFIKRTGATVATGLATQVATNSPVQAEEAGEKLVLAAIGVGGRGTGLLKSFAKERDVQFAYVCDPDSARAARAADAVQKITGKAPKVVSDMRTVFDDTAVDAVIIATPDHWHAPATLLACAAGKHVYVEKPCSHNIREGRLMLEAARKYDRVVQVGTQSRSSGPLIEAMQLLREGAIGDVLVAKAWNSQKRSNIGHAQPGKPPAGLDYDLWLGPTREVPYQSNRLHYTWHWWYDFGTGDMGNDGVHDLDIARWGLGVETHPTTVTAVGGKYFFDDDQQFPDTQYVAFEYPGNGRVGQKKQLIFEQRIWSPYRQEEFENGNAYYGTNGMLILGKNDGWRLYGPRNKLIKSSGAGEMGPPHYRNFLDCIRSGERPNADIEIGHLSAALCHLGNIATRIGRTLLFDPAKEQIVGDEPANQLVSRKYRDDHWAVPRNS